MLRLLARAKAGAHAKGLSFESANLWDKTEVGARLPPFELGKARGCD